MFSPGSKYNNQIFVLQEILFWLLFYCEKIVVILLLKTTDCSLIVKCNPYWKVYVVTYYGLWTIIGAFFLIIRLQIKYSKLI